MSCFIKRILQITEPAELGPVQVFNMEGLDITRACNYSWSNDMVCWTNWTDYDTYLRLSKNLEEDMYLRVLLFDSFSKISLNGLFTNCYNICLDQTSPFLETICNDQLFNPYANMDCALQLQQQLADSVICMLGIPIYYFRTSPKKETADYTFKEYVLHNVTDVKRIKLMVEDGAMPSSNPKFTALDFDWQVDWEVEIGKTDFATAFGDTAFPNDRDFIYIPMMKRMWSVNTAYDEKSEGLLWRSTTWKLSLIKYEDVTNVEIPDNMEGLIDDWIVNKYDDVFGRKEIIEQERLSGTTQVETPKYAATNLTDISIDDAIRRKFSMNDISIIDYQYNHHSNVITRNMYRFKTPDAVITYQKPYCGENGTLSFIIQTQGAFDGNRSILNMGPIQINMSFQSSKHTENNFGEDRYVLEFEDQTAYLKPFNSYLVIARWNRQTFTTNLEVYEYTHQEGVAEYMLRPEMYWFKGEPLYSMVGVYNNDFNVECGQECYIQPYPCLITNIKLYNKDLGIEESLKESIKYTTQHPACVINDLARQISAGHGYMVQ